MDRETVKYCYTYMQKKYSEKHSHIESNSNKRPQKPNKLIYFKTLFEINIKDIATQKAHIIVSLSMADYLLDNFSNGILGVDKTDYNYSDIFIKKMFSAKSAKKNNPTKKDTPKFTLNKVNLTKLTELANRDGIKPEYALNYIIENLNIDNIEIPPLPSKESKQEREQRHERERADKFFLKTPEQAFAILANEK